MKLNKTINTYFLFIMGLLCIAGTQSCTEKIISVNNVFGPSYFPLNHGHAITYRVDSTIYDDFGQGNVYTNSYYMKDVVDSSFVDLQNQTSHVVLRYMRPISDSNFKLVKSYVVTLNNRRIEVIEENLRYIKLIFPFSTSETWLGNNFIGSNGSTDIQWLDNWVYRYGAFGGTYSYGNFSCDSIVTVDQNSLEKYDGDTISTTQYGYVKIATEKYAKDKGMVYKQLHYWKKDPLGGQIVARRKGFTAVLNAISVEN